MPADLPWNSKQRGNKRRNPRTPGRKNNGRVKIQVKTTDFPAIWVLKLCVTVETKIKVWCDMDLMYAEEIFKANISKG